MKKRWFVVILTIGLLLHVLPLSVLALSPDPITDADDWSDLSTVSDSLDDLQEQEPPVPDLLETGSEKSLASNEATADDRSAGNLTLKTLDEESGDEGPPERERPGGWGRGGCSGCPKPAGRSGCRLPSARTSRAPARAAGR